MRFALLFVSIIFLAGCSTTQRPIAYDTVNIRLERMERNILERNKDVEDLKSSIESLSIKVDQIANLNNDGDVFSDDYVGADNTSLNNLSEEKKDEIVRVPVSEKEIQIALKNAGYYDGAIDGKLGKQSIKAVKEFQKDFDLKVDGIVGRKTWAQMKKYLE